MASRIAPSFEEMSADWAWEAFEPASLTPRQIAHFYRRASFGAHPDQRREANGISPRELVGKHLPPFDLEDEFAQEMKIFARRVSRAGDAKQLSAWWLHRLLHSPRPLHERLILFWHGHFATGADKVDDSVAMLNQHQAIRKLAWGKFEPLVLAISRDPAMLNYLDSATNSKTHPNENFARELMELFCLGVGNYSERDIQQVARCFTGWQVNRGKFRFNPYQHDDNTKSFLGAEGTFGGDDAVRIILAQPAAPRFIARKLTRWLVADALLPDKLIDPLAKQLHENDFEIAPVVETILASNLFYSDAAIGGKIRSPIELGVGLMRTLGARGNMNTLANKLGELGERPFYPPNVKGWEGGRDWINSQTLLGRANLVRAIIRSDEVSYTDGSFENFVNQHLSSKSNELVDDLIELLLAVDPPATVRPQLVAAIEQAPNRTEGAKRVIEAISLMPEFHLN